MSRKTASIFAATIAACCAFAVNAAGFDGKTLVTNDWFDASFTAQTVDAVIATSTATGITFGAGTWTSAPTNGTAKIVADEDAGGGATMLAIDAPDEELTFTPAVLASATGMETVSVNVNTVPVDTLTDPEGGAQGAFAIYSANGVDHSLAAYVSDGTTVVWTNLVYANAADLTNVWFTLTMDFATVESVRYVRYSITPPAGSLTVLADTAGTQWFPSADSTATTVQSVSFTGTGDIRTFSGDSLAEVVVATCNGVNYSTVAAAVAAAGDGDTVTLVHNPTLSESIAVAKDVTINGGGNYQLNVASLDIATGKTVTLTNFSSQNTIGAITGGGNIATSGNRTFRLKISGSNYTIGELALGTTQGIRVEGEGTMTVSKLIATASSVLDAFDGAQITIGEVDSDSDITVSLRLVNTTAMTKKGTGVLTFAGVAAPTAGFVVEGGSVIIDNSMDGISPYVWVDASDESTIIETDGKVTEWASLVNGHSYTNEASAMTYVAAEGVFGGKKVVRTNNSQLQAEFTGDKVQSAVAAIRWYSNSGTGRILYGKSGVNNNYIGKRNSGDNFWSCLRTSKTDVSLWQNAGTSDIRFRTYETVLSVAAYYNSGANNEYLGGGSGDIAIAEFIGFNTTDTGCPVRKRTEAYLGNKWSISGMVSLPSSVPLSLAGGTTFGLLGLDRTVDSVSITGTGTATVTGGVLTITAPVSVSVGQTLVIPYGSTYTLASGTGAMVDASAGTVTLKHCAADIDGVVYDSVQDAVDAYESGTLTIYESAELSLTNALTIVGVVLENEAELTFADTVPFTSSYEDGTISCVRNVSTFVYIGPESFAVAPANFTVGGKTASVAPEATDTIQFDTAATIDVTAASYQFAAVVVNANVSLNGGGSHYLYSDNISGTGRLTLENAARVASYSGAATISCELEVNASSSNPAYLYVANSGREITLTGVLSGDGYLKCTRYKNAGDYSGCTFHCSDTTGFSGTIEMVHPGDSVGRNLITFWPTCDFSGAMVIVGNYRSGYGRIIDGQSNNAVYKFGSFSGYVSPSASNVGNNHPTIEIGALGKDDTVTGNWMPHASRNPYIRKVGTGTLTTTAESAYGYILNGGTLKVLATDTAPVTTEVGGKKVVSATETIGEVEYTVYTLDKKRPMVIMVF